MSTPGAPAIANGPVLPAEVWVPSSLIEVLERAAASHAALRYVRADGSERVSSYAELLAEARALPPSTVLQCTEAEELLPRLWASILAGVAPVVIPPGRRVESWPTLGPDVAFALFTSGSTGTPKLVPLTHANVIASVAASAHVNGYTADDVSLNWLPLVHVGALMRSIRETYLACTQIQVATQLVTRDPLVWLDLLTETRATMSWAPNSTFATLLARLPPPEVEDRQSCLSPRPWRLHSLRSLHSSGEPVVASTMGVFRDMLEPHGLRPDALHTAWGMTEACFATFGRIGTGDPIESGRPVPGVSLRIVDDAGHRLIEGERGHLEISGPLVAAGGWLRTGDLGVLRDGVLTIAGRVKEMIKIGGAAYAPAEIEVLVEELPEVERAIACSIDADGGALAIFTTGDVDVHVLRAHVVRRCGITPRFVIPLERVPRSEVGKVQRTALRAEIAQWHRWPYDLRAAAPAGVAADLALAEHIAAVAGDVLGLPFALDDDFFTHGATSLRIVEAAARLRCAVVDLFRAPTARALAAQLAHGGASAALKGAEDAAHRLAAREARARRLRRRGAAGAAE